MTAIFLSETDIFINIFETQIKVQHSNLVIIICRLIMRATSKYMTESEARNTFVFILYPSQYS